MITKYEFGPGNPFRSRPQEMRASVTIRVSDEFRRLPNLPQDRKEKCHELRPTDADAGPDARSFFWRGGTVTPLFRLVDCQEHYIVLGIDANIMTL
jgi:hypothetical protein